LSFSLNKILRIPFFQKIKRQFKKELTRNSGRPGKMAASVAVGLFLGVIPIWGFQTLVAFGVASLFKLNKIVVLLSTNISFPPFIPFIVFISFGIGSLFVSDPIKLPDFNNINKESVYLQLNQYIVGSFVLAFFVAILGFSITYVLLKRRKKNRVNPSMEHQISPDTSE
jgi:uncharacterized protein (DUF2062 family)